MALEATKGLDMILILFGINPNRIVHNYELSDDARAIVAVPDIKVAVTTDKDKLSGFKEDGWLIVPVSKKDIGKFYETLSSLLAIHTANQRKDTLNADKSTSQHEQWLIDGCVRRQLPNPNRNLKFDNPENGRELTTPDMAWEDEKVAFFVDGLWWHTGQDDKKVMDMMSSDLSDDEKKRKLAQQKSAVEKDGNARSIMQTMGWVVLSCSDRDLEKPGGVDRQVDRIEEELQKKWKLAEAKKKLADQGVDLSDLDDLI